MDKGFVAREVGMQGIELRFEPTKLLLEITNMRIPQTKLQKIGESIITAKVWDAYNQTYPGLDQQAEKFPHLISERFFFDMVLRVLRSNVLKT